MNTKPQADANPCRKLDRRGVAARRRCVVACRGVAAQVLLGQAAADARRGAGCNAGRAAAATSLTAHVRATTKPPGLTGLIRPGGCSCCSRASLRTPPARPRLGAGLQPVPAASAARDPDHGPARLPAPLRPRRRRRHRGLATDAGAKAQAADAPPATTARARSKSSARSAATARSAARSTRWSRTASGCARSRCSIRRSTSARTAPRARRCASTATASTA